MSPVETSNGYSNIRNAIDRCNGLSYVLGCLGEVVCNPCTITKTFSGLPLHGIARVKLKFLKGKTCTITIF